MTNVVGPAITIFDLDDTVSDTDHRQGVLEMPMKDIPRYMSRFDCMESLCAFDPPITAMVAKCIEHIERIAMFYDDSEDNIEMWNRMGFKARTTLVKK